MFKQFGSFEDQLYFLLAEYFWKGFVMTDRGEGDVQLFQPILFVEVPQPVDGMLEVRI